MESESSITSGDDAAANNNNNRGMDMGMGMETCNGSELLRIRGAQVFVIDEQESMSIQCGEFSLHVMRESQRQAHSSCLAAAVAMVGDLHWPIGRPISPSSLPCSPFVLKMAPLKYAFILLPGLIYGLSLSFATPVEAQHTLEALLHQYSILHLHPHLYSQDEREWGSEKECWTRMACRVKRTAGEMMMREGEGEEEEEESMKEDEGIMGKESVREKMMRARRMSAVTKLVTKAVVIGAISSTRHVRGMRNDSMNEGMCRIAAVDAFVKVVMAVEGKGRSLLEEEEMHDDGEEGAGLWWTLNREGLRLLVRATAASAVINVARGMSEGREQGVSSSSSEVVVEEERRGKSKGMYCVGDAPPLPPHHQRFVHTPNLNVTALTPLASYPPHQQNQPFHSFNFTLGFDNSSN